MNKIKMEKMVLKYILCNNKSITYPRNYIENSSTTINFTETSNFIHSGIIVTFTTIFVRDYKTRYM